MQRAAAGAVTAVLVYTSKSSSKLFCPVSSLIGRSLTTAIWSPVATAQSQTNAGGGGGGGGGTLLASSSWSVSQLRHARFSAADLKPGNVIERKGKIYQVLKAQHTTQGRGGAKIQVEFRDVDSGNKLNESLHTDEAIDKVYVEEKSFNYLFTEDDAVVLVEPDTYVQIYVPKQLFGDSLPYLQDEMEVTLEFYNGQPMSASIPQKVTCTVAEAQIPLKGSTATPQYKKVKLDNGLTVQVPAHVVAGEKIIINTSNHSYVSRA